MVIINAILTKERILIAKNLYIIDDNCIFYYQKLSIVLF
jgi:hypothetical protein